MDSVDPFRVLFAFLFVLGLIGLMAMVLKRYGRVFQSGSMPAVIGKIVGKVMPATDDLPNRLDIIEIRYIDPRRKLVLIRRDDREHLLLLSNGREGRELVIESFGEKA